jgi:hypothetical protein
MSTLQEYWDACLIKTWRNLGSISNAMHMFEVTTGKMLFESNLLRVPPLGFPWKVGMRVFVAERLPKISERLWSQPPEKDVLLLRKLATSKYDTAKEDTSPDTDLKRQRRQLRRNGKRIAMETLSVSNRNASTDWNVTKGPSQVRRAR